MPSNLASASVIPTSTVFPNTLSTSFNESRGYPILSTLYHDGSIEWSLITDGVNPARAARQWTLTKRLTAAQLSTMRTFWKTTTKGGLKPFYYYPNHSQYDASGANSTGRITCYFRGQWSETLTLGRSDVAALTIVEVL